RPDEPPQALAAGRALDGPVAHHDRRGREGDPPDQRARCLHHPGRAERDAGADARPVRLRAGDRAARDAGQGAGSPARRGCEEGLPGPLNDRNALDRGGNAMTQRVPSVFVTLFAALALVAATAAPSRAADVIKFGISTPLSGPAAPWGIPHKNATELIFDEVNAQGGLDVCGKKYKLEVIAYDHKYVIAEGVATVNRLIAKDGVKYISILGGAVAKANEEAINESGSLGLTLAYAEGLVSPKNPLTFQCFPAPPETTT